MSTIFIVSVGEYSEFRTVGVFDEEHEDDANNLVKLICGDVNEFPLNGPIPEDPGLDFFYVTMNGNGNCQVWQQPRLDTDGSRQKEKRYLRTQKDYPHERKSYWVLQCCIYAKSEEHAKRHANELRRQILAGQRPPSVNMGNN